MREGSAEMPALGKGATTDGAPVFEGVTDVHINVANLNQSVLFPGPRRAQEDAMGAIRLLAAACDRVAKTDFMIWESGICWRGRRDELAVDGTWFRLRRMPPLAPSLESLPSPLPAGLVTMLLMPSLSRGGLIYFVGAPGSGKSTTASGTVVSRLKKFGGYAYTVEDPPEMPINGWHGSGYCAQSWVPGESIADWVEAMRGALRSQPSATPCMLYVGEVRDTDSARTMLRAAANGFLVIATGFGNDIPAGLESLVALAGNDALPALASTLRLCVYTRLVNGNLLPNVLASAGPNTQVGLRIRQGQLGQIVGEVHTQANQMRSGINPLALVVTDHV